MTRCICSTAYLRLSSCGDVQYASLASCLSFPFPYPVFLIVRHLLSASLHPAAASPCRASPVTWRWVVYMSSYILHSRATLPSTSRICRRSYIKMAIILPMTATKMIYPKMILCCNGIRFFSIRITSYPLKKQILTTADLASSTCNKTQQYLSILLIPTERRAYNTSSFLYPNTVLTAFGNSRQYTGSSESKDGTHTDAAAVLTVPVTAHATIGLHVPVPCEEFRVLRRRPKPLTASKIILAVCGNFLHPCV